MTTTETIKSACVEMELTIEAPIERVWASLVEETGKWWPKEFYSGEAQDFVLEPRVGGLLYEDNGQGTGATWFRVDVIRPPRSLQLSGHLAPPFGGPATSLVHIDLEALENGHTTFRLKDHLFGVLPECGNMESGWRTIFEERFKGYVEGR